MVVKRIIRIGIYFVIFVFVLTTVPPVYAQQDPTPAPVPAQILTAKRVFISNWGSTAWAPADLTYNEFYSAMKSWGRYELLSAPSDADLILEIHFEDSGGTNRLRLMILDPKTHTVLWAFTEYVAPWNTKSGARKSLDKSMGALSTDMLHLLTPAIPIK